MKFEFFTECQTATRSYYDRYWQILEEVQLADQLGWDSFGTSEQHFTPELFTTSAPEVFYAAVAMRTKRLRLRHGIRLLPYRVNHPLRIAEQVAMLDILSNGRAELGTGRGNTLRMLRAFEVDPKESREQWEEALSMIPKMWTQDPFSGGKVLSYTAHPRGPKAHSKAAPRNLDSRNQSRHVRNRGS